MAQVFSNSLYPPDNSGEWYDDGWGGWVKDVTVVGQVPTGYEDDGWGVLVPTEANPTIDKTTETNVRKTISEAKTFGETKVGRILSDVLDFGLPVLKKLVDAGVIKNVNSPISLSNIDTEKAKAYYDKGGATTTKVIEVPKTDPKAPNSTFFGIDFSNGLNVALLVLALIGLWMLISKSSNPSPQSQVSEQRTIKRTGQRRVVNV